MDTARQQRKRTSPKKQFLDLRESLHVYLVLSDYKMSYSTFPDLIACYNYM